MTPASTTLQTAAGYGYHDVAQHPAAVAARVVVRLMRDRLKFSSVLDVGCGVGLWLREFEVQGIPDIMGLDGPWVPRENLVIAPDKFRVQELAVPFRLRRSFDLVMCLEVAEHVPVTAADALLDSITEHGDLVVFSAAIPGQGGFLHVNEQMQDYWIERFRRRGLTAYDVLRPALWNHPDVPYYYAQNTLVYSRTPLPFPTEFIPTPIHPELYRRRTDPRHYPLGPVARLLPHYAGRAWRRLWRNGAEKQ